MNGCYATSFVGCKNSNSLSNANKLSVCAWGRLHRIFKTTRLIFNGFDGRGLRISAFGAVDSVLIPIQVKPMNVKWLFTASLLDAQNWRNSVESKPASLLVVSFGTALIGIFLISQRQTGGRQLPSKLVVAL